GGDDFTDRPHLACSAVPQSCTTDAAEGITPASPRPVVTSFRLGSVWCPQCLALGGGVGE
ncbi:MAG: hypothetical protein M3332_13590, partial [Actinomycetota bacterium]|nr:hypothetical protein [Actinomycetota bacterium]